VTPHFAQNNSCRRSAINGPTTCHDGNKMSQRKRKRAEEIFGWFKASALLRKTRHKSAAQEDWTFTFASTANNLLRTRNILGTTT
jgi:hypothetical protein